jgi:hypothetical protein
VTGAISGATAVNTINGAIINSSTQTFGSHAITDSGALAMNSGSGTNLTLDSVGGTSTVNIGTTNATTVAIGRTNETLQLKGVTTPVANGILYIKDTNGGIEETAASTGIQCLQTSGSGTAPTWGSCGSSNNFTAGQDLSGSAASQTVVGIQGNPVSSATPLTNQVLTWSGSAWAPQDSANQWTTANGGCVPTTYTVAYTDSAFQSSGTTATETLLSLTSSRQKLCGAVNDPQVAFAGSGISTITCSLGSATSGNSGMYLPSLNMMQTPESVSQGGLFSGRDLATPDSNLAVVLTCTATGGNFGTAGATSLTAGKAWITVYTTTLPAGN